MSLANEDSRNVMACAFPECQHHATCHVVEASRRKCVEEHHLCAAHWESYRQYRSGDNWYAADFSESLPGHLCFDIEVVVLDQLSHSQPIYLRHDESHTRFGISLGFFEATTIFWLLKGLESRRPLTHAAMASAIEAMGGTLRYSLVDSWNGEFFTAKLHIVQFASEIRIDVRPSDAIALALVSRVPIFLTERLVAELPRLNTTTS